MGEGQTGALVLVPTSVIPGVAAVLARVWHREIDGHTVRLVVEVEFEAAGAVEVVAEWVR